MTPHAESAPTPGAPRRPRVVILGAGFAGLYCARGLRRAPVDVTIVDRRNHHTFQPLLYQVATAGLSPGEIAAPIRHILSSQNNVDVVLAEATGIDAEKRVVHLARGSLEYDVLVLATGAQTSYFGNDHWERVAPGLKTIDDALEMRRRFLLAFEAAEREADPEVRRAALTFVIVGGGPTGVELAGTMAELSRRAFIRDFRRIDPTTARVILIEASERLLDAFDPDLSARARRDLERLGVQVWLNTMVTDIDESGVRIGEERLSARNVFWAAGVRASELGACLPAETDKGGRVRVKSDLTIEGHPEIFVLGDLARATDADTRNEVPGIAPAAIQMGRFAARIIKREAQGKLAPADRPAFDYTDKGMLATIGRARAVGAVGRLKVKGVLAWLMWLVVHIFYLIGFRNRLIVMIQWAWSYMTFERGARLITGDQPKAPDQARCAADESPPEPVRPAHHDAPPDHTHRA